MRNAISSQLVTQMLSYSLYVCTEFQLNDADISKHAADGC